MVNNQHWILFSTFPSLFYSSLSLSLSKRFFPLIKCSTFSFFPCDDGVKIDGAKNEYPGLEKEGEGETDRENVQTSSDEIEGKRDSKEKLRMRIHCMSDPLLLSLSLFLSPHSLTAKG